MSSFEPPRLYKDLQVTIDNGIKRHRVRPPRVSREGHAMNKPLLPIVRVIVYLLIAVLVVLTISNIDTRLDDLESQSHAPHPLVVD